MYYVLYIYSKREKMSFRGTKQKKGGGGEGGAATNRSRLVGQVEYFRAKYTAGQMQRGKKTQRQTDRGLHVHE
jgi:hypothetical protein